MNIAELVLNLGVKGSDKSASALTSVQKSLKDTSSMALETKVALAGAVYALERLFAASGQRGTDLQNFNTITGISVQRLQQYQYAARQVGASNEEMEGTFKGLQAQMTEVLTNGGAPAGMAHVADVLGINISEDDIKEFAKKPEKLLQILQEYAQKEQDIGLKRKTLGTFSGVTDNIQAGLNKGVFNEPNLAKAPTYSNREVKGLNDSRAAFSDLQNKIEMQVGRFNAAHGQELISGISRIADEIFKLVNAFEQLAEKMGLFTKILPAVIEGWTKIFQMLSAFVGEASDKRSIGEKIHDYAFGTKEEQEAHAKQKANEAALKTKIQANTKNGIPPPAGYTPEGDVIQSPVAKSTPSSPVAAPVSAGAKQGGKVIPITSAVKVATPVVLPTVHNTVNTQEVKIDQTLNFNHDGTNAQKIGSDHKKAANEAYRQQPQSQVK